MRKGRYLKFEKLISRNTDGTETGLVPKNQEMCGGQILSERGTKGFEKDEPEVIFQNKFLMILERCSHHEIKADLAQIF